MTALAAHNLIDELCEPLPVPAMLERKSASGAKTQTEPDQTEAIAAIGGAVVKLASDMKSMHGQTLRLHEQFKEANDESLEQKGKAGSDDVVTREKVGKLNAALDAANETIKRLRADQIKSGRPGLGIGAPKGKSAFDLYRAGVIHHLRTGDQHYKGISLRDLEQKAMVAGTPADGGYIVFPEQGKTILEKNLATFTPLRNIVNVRTTSKGSIKDVVDTTGGVESGWVGETAARPETGTPTLAELEIHAMEVYAQPKASQTLLDDAEQDIEAWLYAKGARGFAEKEAPAFVTGDGVNKPKGFLAYTMVANASWTWGSVGFVASGSAATIGTGTAASDKLIDLMYSVKAGYRTNGSFLMSGLTQAEVRKIKDLEGRYVWQPAIALGAPATLHGAPVTDVEEMPVQGANAYPIAFGDMKEAYTILDRLGIRIIRDPYTAKPHILFYMTKRVGGAITNFEAFKVLKCAV